MVITRSASSNPNCAGNKLGPEIYINEVKKPSNLQELCYTLILREQHILEVLMMRLKSRGVCDPLYDVLCHLVSKMNLDKKHILAKQLECIQEEEQRLQFMLERDCSLDRLHRENIEARVKMYDIYWELCDV